MSKLAIMMAVVMASACNTESTSDPTNVGKFVAEMCGEAPLAPGWSVAVKDGVASMSAADFNAISDWRDSVVAWRDCVTHLD